MNIIKPPKLKQGDTIGILSVSGGISDYDNILRAKDYFISQGFKVKISGTTSKHFRYMAGSDDDRINALEDAFSDPEIDAIVCSRGGYGALRIVDKINYEIIKNHPKIFVGYSDITILLSMIFKQTGLITFHGAMMNGDFGKDEICDYTKNSFFNTLLSGQKEFRADENYKVINPGTAKGILWGGNLASLVSMLPLDFVPDEDIILFLEDLNEPVYKIDKMLTQLFNIPKIRKHVKGIAYGDFLDCGNDEQLMELLTEISSKYSLPASIGFKFTHSKVKDTVPYGVEVLYSSDNGLLRVENNYLKQ